MKMFKVKQRFFFMTLEPKVVAGDKIPKEIPRKTYSVFFAEFQKFSVLIMSLSDK